MSFYVTLPSHANQREFPNNQANSFKIRLPQPLQLTGAGWQVGLSAISLPDARVNLYELVKKDGYIISTSWDQTYPAPGKTDGTMAGSPGSAQTLINDVKDLDWVVDGVSFMKAAIAHLEQRRKETAIQGGRFVNDQGKHMYSTARNYLPICHGFTSVKLQIDTPFSPRHRRGVPRKTAGFTGVFCGKQYRGNR